MSLGRPSCIKVLYLPAERFGNSLYAHKRITRILRTIRLRRFYGIANLRRFKSISRGQIRSRWTTYWPDARAWPTLSANLNRHRSPMVRLAKIFRGYFEWFYCSSSVSSTDSLLIEITRGAYAKFKRLLERRMASRIYKLY